MRPPEFWTRDSGSARAVSAILSPLAWLYGASVAYKRDHTTPFRPKAKVVCVGNISAGGSGKTPVAIALARALLTKGAKIMFLTRGYGGRISGPVLVDPNRHGAKDVGDEPLLLADVAPTIVARNRKAGAALADSRGANVIIMDDGHQNFLLARDLSIVTVDAESGFGNGHVLPAGPLREPVAQGLARADCIVLVGDGDPDLPDFRGPVLRAHLRAAAMPPAGSRVVAFAGIGRPEKFFATLASLDVDILDRFAFADHRVYTRADILGLRNKAANAGAMLMTTEKDYVRLNPSDRAGIVALPIRAEFETREEPDRLLDGLAMRLRPSP